ncbi:hypothetical protein DFJ43DRAFT_1009171, partial [Lentinula guzmanii]
LVPGHYIIRNGDNIVSQHFAEDRSLLPKKVVLAPCDRQYIWIFEKTGENEYIINSYGSQTARIDQGVFVILMDLEPTN